MAKKKSVSKTKAKRASKKPRVLKARAVARATTKVPNRKAAARKAKAVKKPTAKTVDGIVKAFEKKRVTQHATLAATRKKIELLTKRIVAVRTELENLKKTAVETEISIQTLDSRRDAEVGELLSGMGIDLDKAAAAAKAKVSEEKGTPLFDGPAKEDSTDDSNNADAG